MTVKPDKEELRINLKMVMAVVAAVSLIAGWGGSYVALKMSLGHLAESHHVHAADHHSKDYVSRAEFIGLRTEIVRMDDRQRDMVSTLAAIKAALERP